MTTDVERQAEIAGTDGFAIGDAGRAATELGAGRPTRFPDSADHELSECRVEGASVRAASVRGLMHRYRDQPRQDRFSIVYDPPTMTLIVTVCDGVGQFGLSQEAAAFVAADLPRALLIHHHWDRAVAEVNERLKHFVAAAASRARLDDLPSDARMATTLAAAAVCLDPRDRRVSVAWTDDSSAWLLSRRKWYNLTPDPDESGDDGVHSGRVKALPHAEPRLRTTEYDIGDGALFLMTDGVGVPLGGSVQVKETLADWWAAPPNLFEFAQQVGFARRGHLDDRTVVGVWFEPAET